MIVVLQSGSFCADFDNRLVPFLTGTRPRPTSTIVITTGWRTWMLIRRRTHVGKSEAASSLMYMDFDLLACGTMTSNVAQAGDIVAEVPDIADACCASLWLLARS